MSQGQQTLKFPWEKYNKNWASKLLQSVNSPEYKELRPYIHMPYRKIDHQGVKCYYFPTYVIFKVKNITDFDFESLSARINGVLIIDIMKDYKDKYYLDEEKKVTQALKNLFDDAPKDKKDQASAVDPRKPESKASDSNNGKKPEKTEYLYVQFNRDNPLRLPTKRIFEGQINCVKQQKRIVWTIRKEFRISLQPGKWDDDLIAPFNLLHFRLSLTFEDVDIKFPQGEMGEMVKFKFNCMKRVGDDSSELKKKIFEQINFSDDGSLGEYDLAETSLSVKCEKFRSEESKTNTDSYSSYKVISFNIPFYKYPIMDALTIFIPLVLITILTLFTFVQGPDFNDKIGNIATLMIVYNGLVPVINDSLPPTTKLTLIDTVVYAQLVTNALCVIRGYLIKDYDVNQFAEYMIWSDPFFIVSLCLAITSGVILISLLVYYCIMKSHYYNLEEADVDESERNTRHWVSPHMYNEARNLKTAISKLEEEDKKKKEEEEKKKKKEGVKVEGVKVEEMKVEGVKVEEMKGMKGMKEEEMKKEEK